MFLTGEEDREVAVAKMNSLNSPTPQQSNSANNGYSTNYSYDESTRKLAHNMVSRFKRDNRVTGKLGDDINEAINNYIDGAVHYQLNQKHEFKFLHKLFDGDAKRFYRDKALNQRITSFAEASVIMKEEYNITTRQKRVQKMLQVLLINYLKKGKGCNVSDALEELRGMIKTYAPQGPRTHRLEQDKVEYLTDVVIGADSASNALTQAIASE